VGIGGKAGRYMVPAACLAAVAGCDTPGPPRPHAHGEVITYETEGGFLCGRCDALKVAVAADGAVWIEQGHWAGDYADWRTQERALHLPPQRIAAFRGALARYRPARDLGLDAPESCATFWSDQPGLRVTWDDGRARVRLVYNYGCDPEARRAMREELERAPLLLGVRGLAVPVARGVPSTRM